MLALQKFSLDAPILTGLLLLLIALFFRVVDIFVLHLDERLGEIILSKSLGFILVAFFVWGTGHRLKSIGLHSSFIGESLLIGLFVTIIALIIGYSVEFIIQYQRGVHPSLSFGAIDPKAGITGGILFGLWLLTGNFINSFMEEGLFRGLMIPLYGSKVSLWQAIWLQALLFGAWHLIWVLKGYQTGQFRTPGELAFGILANFVPQLFLGIVWGYMYVKTNNLWTSWISHTLTNSALNFLHINTDGGMNSGIAVRMITYIIIMLMALLLIKFYSNQLLMPEVKPWRYVIR